MVKMTYVPNRIGIPTYGDDLGHHELRMEEKAQESPMESPQPKSGGGRKRWGGKKDKELLAMFYVHQLRRFNRSHAMSGGVTYEGVVASTPVWLDQRGTTAATVEANHTSAYGATSL
jgi:hypothetical protein